MEEILMEEIINEDKVCYADGIVVTASEEGKKPNKNELIVGMTGVGKSFSNVSARLLYTSQSSMVVPITKKEIREKFMSIFKSRGYETMSIDFSNPESSTIGYDPMDYIKNERDTMELARRLVGAVESKDMNGKSDPYWNDSATNVLAALIELIIILRKKDDIEPRLADVVYLYKKMIVYREGDAFSSSIDPLFETAEKIQPGNQATMLWKTIKGLANRTASCILSIVNNALNAVATKEIMDLTKRTRKISFKDIGKKKTILFICSAPYDKTATKFINIMYSDMFKELFSAAEKTTDGRLNIPVHIICDDFACGSRIQNFEEYISVFRATGISVTLLLQSESQLEGMYGKCAAQTIINNCATYIYMGGMDITTCSNISQKIDRSISHIMSMPLGNLILMRCGEKFAEAKRYQILKDPIYQRYFGNSMDDRA